MGPVTMEVSRAGSLIYLFIRQILLQAALLASIAQQGGERTEAKVIVVLPGELLHSQGVERVHLLGQNLGDGNRRKQPVSPQTLLLHLGKVTDMRS